MLRFSTCAIFLAVMGLSIPALADTLGPLDGRSPNPAQMSEMSAEVGYVNEGDFTSLSARLNYQYTPLMTLYGDVGLIDLRGDSDGIGFGVGARYYLENQRIVPELDLAVRASYHLSDASDLSELSAAVHVGGKEALNSNGFNWYGVLSLNRLAFDRANGGRDSHVEIGFGGGFYMPLGPGQLYVGIEHIDEVFFGIGFRHFLGDASY